MNFLFRVDGSASIGGGHISRCINLANKLRMEDRSRIMFVCRRLVKSLLKKIENAGYDVVIIREDDETFFDETSDATQTIKVINNFFDGGCQCIVVDHYLISAKWHETVMAYTRKIMVIDDLADRKLGCNILLNQNHCTEETRVRYQSLVPEKCEIFCGLEYLLLSDNFLKEKEKRTHVRSDNITNLLIFFGLGDVGPEIYKVLNVFYKLSFDNLKITVIISEELKQKNELIELSKKINGCEVLIGTEQMSEIVNESDFCIGSAGMNMWERIYLGLPSLVTAIASNQLEAIQFALSAGAILKTSDQFSPDESDYFKIIKDIFMEKKYPISKLSQNCYNLFRADNFKASEKLKDSIIKVR